MDLLSTAQVAKILGVSLRRAQAIAVARGIGRKVGNSFVFTREDVAKMKPGPPGRPVTKPPRRKGKS